MRRVSSKAAAMIAMIISIGGFALLIAAFIVMRHEIPRDEGVSLSFALWIYSVIVALVSLVFYSIDAVISVAKIFQKIHPLFNTVLALALIGAIPMLLYIGGRAGIENICMWTAYHIMIVALEAVSIVKHIKLQREDAKRRKKVFAWFRT